MLLFIAIGLSIGVFLLFVWGAPEKDSSFDVVGRITSWLIAMVGIWVFLVAIPRSSAYSEPEPFYTLQVNGIHYVCEHGKTEYDPSFIAPNLKPFMKVDTNNPGTCLEWKE